MTLTGTGSSALQVERHPLVVGDSGIPSSTMRTCSKHSETCLCRPSHLDSSFSPLTRTISGRFSTTSIARLDGKHSVVTARFVPATSVPTGHQARRNGAWYRSCSLIWEAEVSGTRNSRQAVVRMASSIKLCKRGDVELL